MTHVARAAEAAGVAEIARAIPATPWKTLRVSHGFHRLDNERVKHFQLSTDPGQSQHPLIAYLFKSCCAILST